MKEQTKKLIESILQWWAEHEDDLVQHSNDVFCIYPSEPKFVKLAKEMIEQNEDSAEL